jgi:hypothetical protein
VLNNYLQLSSSVVCDNFIITTDCNIIRAYGLVEASKPFIKGDPSISNGHVVMICGSPGMKTSMAMTQRHRNRFDWNMCIMNPDASHQIEQSGSTQH